MCQGDVAQVGKARIVAIFVFTLSTWKNHVDGPDSEKTSGPRSYKRKGTISIRNNIINGYRQS